MNTGYIGYLGNANRAWSNTAITYSGPWIWGSDAYGFAFDWTVYTTLGPTARWYGFPVRRLVILVRIISNDITRLRVPVA